MCLTPAPHPRATSTPIHIHKINFSAYIHTELHYPLPITLTPVHHTLIPHSYTTLLYPYTTYAHTCTLTRTAHTYPHTYTLYLVHRLKCLTEQECDPLNILCKISKELGNVTHTHAYMYMRTYVQLYTCVAHTLVHYLKRFEKIFENILSLYLYMYICIYENIFACFLRMTKSSKNNRLWVTLPR